MLAAALRLGLELAVVASIVPPYEKGRYFDAATAYDEGAVTA